ncbi:PilZ domain-containing protein [bacterium]|nr:PilZ domain-containing protein [bacterium]
MVFRAIKSLVTGKKKAKKTDIERREYPRLDIKAVVNYLAYSSIDSIKEYQAYTKNISGGGVCISTVNCITRNTILELEVKIPGYSSMINALACVVYSRGNEVDNDFDTGVYFTNISNEEKKYIMEYANRVIRDTKTKESK